MLVSFALVSFALVSFALVSFADVADPPVRPPLGSGTVAAVEAEHEADRAILDNGRGVSLSTDFPAA